MSLPNPDERIQYAIHTGVAWLSSAQISGTRIKNVAIAPIRFENHTATTDRITVADSSAPPLWTRYYEIETNRPFFCNRDGMKVYSLAEVKLERRSGYAWYGRWPTALIENEYPAWKKHLGGRGGCQGERGHCQRHQCND